MHHVPGADETVVGGVLAHRADPDAIAELNPSEGVGIEEMGSFYAHIVKNRANFARNLPN